MTGFFSWEVIHKDNSAGFGLSKECFLHIFYEVCPWTEIIQIKIDENIVKQQGLNVQVFFSFP